MSFEPKKVYNFETLAPAILGNDFKLMRVEAILTATEAVKYRDIYTLHTTMRNVVTGLPESVNDCNYILFEYINDNTKGKVLLAREYIDIFSVTEVETTNIRIDILNTSINDMAILRTRLLELGYTNFNLSTF